MSFGCILSIAAILMLFSLGLFCVVQEHDTVVSSLMKVVCCLLIALFVVF